jgi:hypothetical protein
MSSLYHAPLAFSAFVNTADINLIAGDLDAAIAALDVRLDALDGITTGGVAFTQLNLGGVDDTLTIASGIITISRTSHVMDVETGSSDDLDTIAGFTAGDLLTLQIVSGARPITVKHDTGNIFLADAKDRTISDVRHMLMLKYDAVNAKWIEHKPGDYAINMREILSNHTTYNVEELRIPDRTPVNLSNNILRLLLRPNAAASKIFEVVAVGATPFVAANGMILPTVTGTASVSNQSSSAYTNFLTTTGANNTAGIISTTFNLTRRSHDPSGFIWLKTGAAADIVDVRFFIGLFSAAPANADDPSASCVGIRFSSATDGGWVGIVSSGAAAVSVTASLGAVAADTAYLLSWRIDTTLQRAYFSLNNGTEVELDSNLPAAATELGLVARVINTDAGETNNWLLSRIYVEHA